MITSTVRTPYNQLSMSIVLKSIDRKVYRDQYCLECGHPFMAISDKYVRLYDGSTPVELLRTDERVIEQRCKYHYCKQYYRIEV